MTELEEQIQTQRYKEEELFLLSVNKMHSIYFTTYLPEKLMAPLVRALELCMVFLIKV